MSDTEQQPAEAQPATDPNAALMSVEQPQDAATDVSEPPSPEPVPISAPAEQAEPAPADATAQQDTPAAGFPGVHGLTDTHAIVERAGKFLVIALSIWPLADVLSLIDAGYLPSHPDIRSFDDLDWAKRAAGLGPSAPQEPLPESA